MPDRSALVFASFALVGLASAACIAVAAAPPDASTADQGHAPAAAFAPVVQVHEAAKFDAEVRLPAVVHGSWEKLFSAWGR